jgi:hypothetical protein
MYLAQLVVHAVESEGTGPFVDADPVGNSNFDVNRKFAAGCVDCGDLALRCWLALIGRQRSVCKFVTTCDESDYLGSVFRRIKRLTGENPYEGPCDDSAGIIRVGIYRLRA